MLKFETEAGTTHEALVVHKSAHPGSLVIDRRTGVILTAINDRPDWADGFAVALLHEHSQFYRTRLGAYSPPQVYDAADLGWIGVDEEGNEVELEASTEYRQEALASALGIDRKYGDLGLATDWLAETEIALSHYRSPEEASAIEDAQERGFTPLRAVK